MNWHNCFYLMIALAGFGTTDDDGYDEELGEFEVVFCYDGSMRILHKAKEIIKI